MQSRLIEAVQSVFPEWLPTSDLACVRFHEIPGWDSMNGVNLQMEVEARLGVDLSDRPIRRDETLQELLDYLSSTASR